jgi:hypothetical protein
MEQNKRERNLTIILQQTENISMKKRKFKLKILSINSGIMIRKYIKACYQQFGKNFKKRESLLTNGISERKFSNKFSNRKKTDICLKNLNNENPKKCEA